MGDCHDDGPWVMGGTMLYSPWVMDGTMLYNPWPMGGWEQCIAHGSWAVQHCTTHGPQDGESVVWPMGHGWYNVVWPMGHGVVHRCTALYGPWVMGFFSRCMAHGSWGKNRWTVWDFHNQSTSPLLASVLASQELCSEVPLDPESRYLPMQCSDVLVGSTQWAIQSSCSYLPCYIVQCNRCVFSPRFPNPHYISLPPPCYCTTR